MSDMKDIVTDDMVKNALRSDTVTTAVKTQIKSTLDQQIDAAVDTALTDILGSDADNTVTYRCNRHYSRPSVRGCNSSSQEVKPAGFPPLPQQARQKPRPEYCSPSCLAKLTSWRESSQKRLMSVMPPEAHASEHTKP